MIEAAPEEQHRTRQPRGALEQRRNMAPVVRGSRLQGQRRIRYERDASPQTIADRSDIAGQSCSLEPTVRRTNIGVEALFGDGLKVWHDPWEIRVTAFEARRCTVEQLGRNGYETRLSKSSDDVANMRVDSERLLKDEKAAFR